MGVKTRKLGNIDNQLLEWQSSIFVGDGSTGLTAVAGRGYFIDTESGAVTVTLPSDTDGAVNIGDQVAFKDFKRTFGTNALSFATNKFDGVGGQTPSFETAGQSVHLIYAGNTNGWQLIGDDTVTGLGAQYIAATGGTIATSGNFKIHTFTGDGCFAVSAAGNASGANTVDYLVIAGGGAGGAHGGDGSTVGGGGGAGGYRESSGAASGCYTVSPLGACVAALPVSVTNYPITVGAGGTSSFPGNSSTSSKGSNSIFSTITSTGGGGGNGSGMDCAARGNGGSGGGGRAYNSTIPGGTGNTPPVSPPQGSNGGAGKNDRLGGGGGGATQAGADGGDSSPRNKGGDGATSNITGSPVTRAGGGGGANTNGSPSGGAGGGGSSPTSTSGGDGGAGTANTGGGGGGGPHGRTPNANGGAGGKGIVIIRYQFQG